MSAEKSRIEPASPALSHWLKYSAELVAIAIIYLATAKFCLGLASIHPSASPIWIPTGFALAAMLLRGYRVWPAILLAAFVANATTVGSPATSFAIAIGNTLESVVAATLIHRWAEGVSTFDTPAGVGRFAAICFISTIVSATIGVGSLSIAGFANWASFSSIWMTWWMGDLAGALLVTPVIVLWAQSPAASLERRALIRSGAVFLATIAIGLIAFSPLPEQSATRGPLAFLCLVPLMWTALRHNRRDTATTALILSCFAVWGTIVDSGPFARGNLNDSFLLLIAFMISVSVPSLALSADVAMRERHERHIEMVMMELSHRSKNLLAVVQSIARQVARHSENFEDFNAGFAARIGALASSHDLLVTQEWRGADIRDVVRTQLEPFQQHDQSRLTIKGPGLLLSPKAVEQIGMALHELATNATKYGALSAPAGAVSISWTVAADGSEPEQLRIVWHEHGGPPTMSPRREGFGHMVITRLVPKALDGDARLDFLVEGLRWAIAIPTASIAATGRVTTLR